MAEFVVPFRKEINDIIRASTEKDWQKGVK